MHIDLRASIGDPNGGRINLSVLADFLSRRPELIVAVEFDPFSGSIFAINLVDPESPRPPGFNEFFVEAERVEVDVDGSRLLFKPEPPARVADNATITGEEGETLTLEQLEPGQKAFVRGEKIGDETLITAITLIPRIDAIEVIIQTGDFDEEGVDNDVQVDVVTQDGVTISLPVRLSLGFELTVETRSGHVFHNLQPGPYIISAEIPSLPDLFGQSRVFISALGTAFKVVETSPAANATGVAQTTDIAITFNEALQQSGGFVSIAGSLNPAVEGQDLRQLIMLQNEGKTVVFEGVKLAEGTDYTLSITSATSNLGNNLQPFTLQFTTGQSLAQVGSLGGSVTVAGDVQFVGRVRLFDSEGKQIGETPLDPQGGFTIGSIFEGTYQIYAEVEAADGRVASGFVDDNNDGIVDDLILDPGQDRTGLSVALRLPEPVQTGESGGVNRDATIFIDLDTRVDNQELDSLKVLPDSEVRMVVYAVGVEDLVGFDISFNYDTTTVSFQNVEENVGTEINLLRINGGLAVTLPPKITVSNVKYAGAVLGASEEQRASGDGPLGVFVLRTKRGLSKRTEFLIPRVLLQSSTSTDTIRALARATLIPSTTRILMTLSADPDTIQAENGTAATIRAELRDAAGETVTEETTVRFETTFGTGTLSETEVTTSTGLAEVQFSGQTAGNVTVQANAGGASETVTVYVQGAPGAAPAGPVGPVALDAELTTGDQGQRVTPIPSGGDSLITIDVAVTEGALGITAAEVVLEFDSTLVKFSQFVPADLLSGALIVPLPRGNRITLNIALLGGASAPRDAGSLGRATFTTLGELTTETKVNLVSTSFTTSEGLKTLDIGSGGATMVIGGTAPVSSEPNPDFDGNGIVDFTDFVIFAQKFGSVQGQPNFDSNCDLDGSGDIEFGDFVLFAQKFGQSVKPAVLTKPTGQLGPGANHKAGLTLLPRAGETSDEVEVVVRLTDAVEVGGYNLRFSYDASALEWVGSQTAAASRFASNGQAQPALSASAVPGEGVLADVLRSDAVVQGEAELVRLRFRVLDETIAGQVEIVEALVSDGLGRINELVGAHMTEVRALPGEYALNQNYPNPFNPETIVPFALPQAGEVRVAVYNILGQEVTLLIQGHREAGFHRVVWNGKDLFGRSLASGVYFVQMTADGFSGVRKMLLLK